MLNDRGKAFLEILVVLFIQLIFVVIKIIGLVDWAWGWVLAPMWIYLLWVLLGTIIVLMRFRGK